MAVAQTPRPVDARTAARLIEGGALMIDIREPGEFAVAHIPGSSNVALSGLANAALPIVPGQAVVFLCASGNRTSLYADRLAEKAGEATAYVLQGGLSAWTRAGLPAEAGNGGAAESGKERLPVSAPLFRR